MPGPKETPRDPQGWHSDATTGLGELAAGGQKYQEEVETWINQWRHQAREFTAWVKSLGAASAKMKAKVTGVVEADNWHSKAEPGRDSLGHGHI